MLDRYELEARQRPALVVLSPLIVSVYCTFPELQNFLGALGGLMVTLGVVGTLAHLSRGPGKRKEKTLFERWGGKPTTAMLRHRDDRINRVTKSRYHQYLRNVDPGFDIPTGRQEGENSEFADEIYEAAGDWLRKITRNKKKCPLVYAENISYGFSRNLWAMKPIGLTISLLSVVGLATDVGFTWGETDPARPVKVLGLLFDLTVAMVWIGIVSPKWVELRGNAYAKALLEVCQEG